MHGMWDIYKNLGVQVVDDAEYLSVANGFKYTPLCLRVRTLEQTARVS